MVSTMMKLMRDHNVPSLAVHDSLVVAQSAINIADQVLRARFQSITRMEAQLTVRSKALTVS